MKHVGKIIIALATVSATYAVAQALDLPPGLTITPDGAPILSAPSFLPAWIAPWWNWIATPAVLVWIASHLRAWFPVLGQLGWLTTLGDWLAGNYLNATNAKNAKA